jgi:hypothetical protein
MGKMGTIMAAATSLLMGCTNSSKAPGEGTVPIGEGTFVYKAKVYKILNNELRQIADLESSQIRKLEISKPSLKDLGEASLDFVKKGASVEVKSIYRGNFLYFRLRFEGINDLRENYLPGQFTLDFLDDFHFVINTVEIPTVEIVRVFASDGSTDSYEYNGKIELNTEAEEAISNCSMSSTVKLK